MWGLSAAGAQTLRTADWCFFQKAAVADSHVTVIRPYKTHIVSEYLYYYFASNTVQSVIEDKSDGSTKQKELATKTVKAYLVPIPPFAEQQRIVQKIKSVTSIMS